MQPLTLTVALRGRFKSKEGQDVTFSDADLRDIAEGYDASEPAPLVVNTPALADPAWGWVKKLSAGNGKVVAELEKLDPGFEERLRKGAFKAVSTRLYPPSALHNPNPGKWYLKHISFKGEMPPPAMPRAAVSFAQASHAGTLSLTGDFIPAHGSSSSFACPPGYRVDRDALASYERAVALQRINPALTIGEAAARVPAVSFGELGEVLTARAAFIEPDIAPPSGWTFDRGQFAIYQRAKALMADDPALTIVEAARRAR